VTSPVAPLLVLQARAQARALLFANGEIASIEQAMLPLFRYAAEEDIPMPTAQAIIEQAFK